MAKHPIPETAMLMKYTPAYVRSLIRKGDLIATLEPIVPESLVRRHMISDEAIVAFFGETHRKTHRADGRNKFVVYMSLAECETVKTVLTANNLGDVAATIRTANKIKAFLPPTILAKAKVKKRGKAV